MSNAEFGKYYEELVIGKIIHHPASKTIFESDNNLFSLMTMNHHPIHINVDYAEKSQYGKILVVGTLVFSLVVGLSVQDISGKAIANLEYENIQHLAPVFIGDTIYAKTIVLSKRESKNQKDRGIISVETTGYNQNNEEVIKFRRSILIKRKHYE